MSTEDDSISSFGNGGSTQSRSPVLDEDGDYQREKRDKISGSLTQFAMIGPDCYQAVGVTQPVLTPGVYKVIRAHNDRYAFEKQQVHVDELIEFPDSKLSAITDEITDFWGSYEAFGAHGFLHRRGYIFHGPPGSGKTCLVQQVIHNVVKDNGVVFLCGNPKFLMDGLMEYRKVEPRTKVLCIFEDIDSIIETYGDDNLLALLDGEGQINYVLNIATTNYPERLDRRIIARPRRFDRVIEIGWPSAAMREHYFIGKLKLQENPAELKKWVDATDSMSFASLAELVISVKCLGKPFDKALAKLIRLNGAEPNSSKFEKAQGQKPATGFAGAANVVIAEDPDGD